jgi:hypothetical protein
MNEVNSIAYLARISECLHVALIAGKANEKELAGSRLARAQELTAKLGDALSHTQRLSTCVEGDLRAALAVRL